MQARIKELEKMLQMYKKAYYVGNPMVSDAEFDRLETELRKLSPNSPVLAMVGTTPTGDIIHDPPMLSADKVHSAIDVVKWAAGNVVTWGFKVDGLSVNIDYEFGDFIRAATRGDGIRGDDVTRQAFYLKDVPHVLPGKITCKVRGEVYMTITNFENLNAVSAVKYENPRNLAAGTLKSKDPSIVKQRGLNFMAWDLIVPGKLISVVERIEKLRAMGFITADQGLIDLRAIPDLFQKITEVRDRYDFEMDGLVFKINDPKKQIEMGATSHHPRWLMALKFEANQGTSPLLFIEWQVSQKGKLTPRATIKSIKLAGVNVEHATLHNARFVLENQIAPGDELVVIRSGDVIPKVIAVAKNSKELVSIPKTCPVCGGLTRFTGVELYCTNPDCGERALRAIQHFVQVVNIEGLGPKSILALWNAGAIKRASDLFKLTDEYMSSLLGVNGRKIYNLLQAYKSLPFDLFLESLNIRSLGSSASRDLAAKYNSFDDLTPQNIMTVLGNGKIAENIIEGLATKPWKPFLAAGVKVKKGEVRSIKSTTVSGG
jgi:DNA ligase (NAD+)